MRTRLPEPLSVPWELKQNLSARSGIDTLADGRSRYWVDEVLKGITPQMLMWWFGHLEGDMELEGRAVPRYRVWHPFNHVYASYVRRTADGSIGPGAQIANLEYLGRDPRYRVQVAATVERLDEEVFVHNVGIGGLHVARMEHTLERVPAGTRFGHFLIVPGTPMRLPGRLAVDLMVPRAKGAAWLRHAIEEMGNLPNFLPRLYEREGGQAHRSPRRPAPASRQP